MLHFFSLAEVNKTFIVKNNNLQSEKELFQQEASTSRKFCLQVG